MQFVHGNLVLHNGRLAQVEAALSGRRYLIIYAADAQGNEPMAYIRESALRPYECPVRHTSCACSETALGLVNLACIACKHRQIK